MNICFWHGLNGPEHRGKTENAMIAKLEAMGAKACPDDKRTWDFPGTVSEFAAQWDDKFMAYPPSKNGEEWSIFITQYGNFGQR